MIHSESDINSKVQKTCIYFPPSQTYALVDTSRAKQQQYFTLAAHDVAAAALLFCTSCGVEVIAVGPSVAGLATLVDWAGQAVLSCPVLSCADAKSMICRT